MIIPLTEIFCEVDDFYRTLEATPPPALLPSAETVNPAWAVPPCTLAPSEMLTLVIAFHLSNYRTFKHFYAHVQQYWRAEFPGLVSYNRFVELMPSMLVPLCVYLDQRKGTSTGLSFVDATKIAVCHNKRIARHQVFEGLAERGKTSIGWFFGFKLHLVVNEVGELLAFCLTPGNVDDRQPVPELTKDLFGKLFGDKGYISQRLFELLFERGLQLITPIRKNMHNYLEPLIDKILLRKRALIETINDQLKNISQIEHSRHRSVTNFMVNLMAGLIAYTHQDKKPSLKLTPKQLALFPDFI